MVNEDESHITRRKKKNRGVARRERSNEPSKLQRSEGVGKLFFEVVESSAGHSIQYPKPPCIRQDKPRRRGEDKTRRDLTSGARERDESSGLCTDVIDYGTLDKRNAEVSPFGVHAIKNSVQTVVDDSPVSWLDCGKKKGAKTRQT